jgi:hypothetical protein
MSRQGTISKDRVKKNGEVFTPDEIVNDMINLCDENLKDADDITYIKNTRLEPTCGDGAILVRILDKKLGRVEKIKAANGNWKEALLYSVASIYGTDITADNVVMSKRRMLEVIENGSTSVLSLAEETPVSWSSNGFKLDTELKNLIEMILDYNIQCGNTLDGKQYKIYKPDFNCWDCSIDLINEQHIFRHKTENDGTESLGFETKQDTLWLTQWKFENTQYISRQCAFNDYKLHMETGVTLEYRNTQPLDIYCTHIDPKEDLMTDYDF